MSAFVQNHPLVRDLTPFLVVTAANRPAVSTAPFGLAIAPEHVIDPTVARNADFCGLLQNLDGRTFGPEGMPMDRWVFFDCCYMPGAIFGFGRPHDAVPPSTRQILGVSNDYRGLVPYSMYIAIPMAAPGAWMGHNLASIAPMLTHENLKGLGTVTKSIALRAFGVQHFFGATQWDTHALYVHSKFGPLELHTAYTPAHSEAKTLTYAFAVTDDALLGAMGAPGISFDRPEPELWIHPDHVETMLAVQDRIEAGERFLIPGPPRADGGVPVATLAHARE